MAGTPSPNKFNICHCGVPVDMLNLTVLNQTTRCGFLVRETTTPKDGEEGKVLGKRKSMIDGTPSAKHGTAGTELTGSSPTPKEGINPGSWT